MICLKNSKTQKVQMKSSTYLVTKPRVMSLYWGITNEYKQIRNKQYVSKTNVFNDSFGGDGDDCCRTG